MTYFFHIGSNKTGTTIIARLIDQHPKIACMNEAFFYQPDHPASIFNPEIVTPRHGFNNEFRSYLRNYIKSTGNYRAPIRRAMENFKRRCGAEMVGDSWINYISHMDKVVRDFPEAKFIYNVRDPRGVFLSGRTFKNRQIGGKILKAMLKRDKILEEYAGKISLFTFKFEDLIRDPLFIMPQLFNYLGYDFQKEYLNYNVKKDPYPKRWGAIKNVRGKLDVKRLDRWKKRLKPKRIEWINEIAEKFMIKYRYEV